MTDKAIQRLKYLCSIIPPLLVEIDEEVFSYKPAPGKWSKKEILGHLIDSATNNHQRFVRTQFEDVPTIFYDQDKWNQYGYYYLIDLKQLIALWAVYNRHLCELITHIPEENLNRECNTGDGKNHTLDFLINDYVDHLEHHLKQIVNYS